MSTLGKYHLYSLQVYRIVEIAASLEKEELEMVEAHRETVMTELSPLLGSSNNNNISQHANAPVLLTSSEPLVESRNKHNWSPLRSGKILLVVGMCIALPAIWIVPNKLKPNYTQGLLQPLQYYHGLDSKQLSEITFGDLAKKTLPDLYADMVKQLSVFNETIQPIDTAEVRKVILKTRDMLDVFSPVYPNTEMGHNTKEYDIWDELRSRIAYGYQIVGEFLDLDHAHMIYTDKEAGKLRDKILDWIRQFKKFDHDHNLDRYLAHPSRDHDHYDHRKESRFFWKDWDDKRPRGYSSAVKSLAALGQQQIDVILGYYKDVFPEESVLEVKIQEVYHNVRKSSRAMIDEHEVLGVFMFPDEPQVQSTMDMLVLAKKYLGDLNDNWTARQHYIEKNEYHDEQVRLAAEVDKAWAEFKQWSTDVDFEGALRALSTRFEQISGIP
jgi:hypothetical protein